MYIKRYGQNQIAIIIQLKNPITNNSKQYRSNEKSSVLQQSYSTNFKQLGELGIVRR